MVITSRIPRYKVALGFNAIVSRIDPRMLDRMFRSIAPLADQIVVVADEKADQPVLDVVYQYTGDVYFSRWVDDFAQARNKALDRTWTPYVAWMDSDEWISPPHAARLDNLMTRPRGLAYYMWNVSPTGDGNTLFVPQVRLFPNKQGVRWEIPIHEQILPSLQRNGIGTQLTDLRIEHEGYLVPETVRRKNRRNLKILKREVKRNPGDWFTRDNYEKAIAFERWHRKVKA
jgi:hypothetical protein